MSSRGVRNDQNTCVSRYYVDDSKSILKNTESIFKYWFTCKDVQKTMSHMICV